MNKGLIAKASISINTPVGKVWDALVNPKMIKRNRAGAGALRKELENDA